MGNRQPRWLTVQQTSVILDTTSAEVCRLLSIGRLSGSKYKQLGRPGRAQWVVDAKSVATERRRNMKRLKAKRTAQNGRGKAA